MGLSKILKESANGSNDDIKYIKQVFQRFNSKCKIDDIEDIGDKIYKVNFKWFNLNDSEIKAIGMKFKNPFIVKYEKSMRLFNLEIYM